MRVELRERTMQFLVFQRNVFAALALLCAVSVTILALLLFTKRERVVVSPPVVEREYWIDGRQVSPTYLEQFGQFVGQLLLSKSPESAQGQRAILLRHTDPAFSGVLRKRLLEEEEILSKQSASFVFYPVDTRADPKTLEVRLEGDREVFVSGNRVSSDRGGYVLSFRFTGSRLLLTGMRIEGDDSE